MKLCNVVMGFLFVFTLASNAAATSLGAKPLNVRQIHNFPVGCLPENEGASIELKSADVIGESLQEDGAPQQWAIELIPGSKPRIVLPGECIAFDMPIDGYRQVGEFHPLEEGKTYSFGLRRGDRLNDWVSKLYVGMFCVQRAPDGHLAYLPYIMNVGPKGRTITYPSCGRYAGLPPAPDGINPPRQ